MLLNCCYCPYIRTILKYVHHFANIAKQFEKIFQQPDFIRISKRYIVNLYNVDMLSNGTFKMKNGVFLKIPKNNLEKIRRAYITYCLRR